MEASASWGVAAAAVAEEVVVMVVAVEEEEKLCPWVRRSRSGQVLAKRGARAQVMIWTATIPKGRPSRRARGGVRGLFRIR